MSYESEEWYNLQIDIKNLKAWFGLKFGLYIDYILTLSTWYIKGSANFRRLRSRIWKSGFWVGFPFWNPWSKISGTIRPARCRPLVRDFDLLNIGYSYPNTEKPGSNK